MGEPVPVFAVAPATATIPAPVPAPASSPAPAPLPRVVLLRPPWLPRLACLHWRAMTRLLFTVAIYVVSLATVVVSCMMTVRSLAVAVARFAMSSTVYCWRYLLSGFAVALCVAP